MTKTSDHITQIGDGYLAWVPFGPDSELPPLELLLVYDAAPDLLAALERLAGWTRDIRFGYGLRGPEQPLDQARAAIAKAKGTEVPA